MPDIVRCKNIVEAIKHLEPNHILAQCLERDGIAVNYQRNDAILMPDGRVAFLCNTMNPHFYRGENSLYKSCKSSLFRIDGRTERIKALAKTYEFMIFLKSLPEVQAYIENNCWYEPWAIAQHYEFATPMIDLTNEIAVAAFFATHRFDRVSKSYVLMREGVGQIRWMLHMFGMPGEDALSPIGVQPFARPSNQFGYGYWIKESDDLTNHTQIVEFEQDYEINLRLKTSMTGPETAYFPNEKIVQMASVIKNENVITNVAIDLFASEADKGYIDPIVSREEIVDILKKAGTYIVDAPVICPEAIHSVGSPFRYQRKIVMLPAYSGQEL